MGVLTELVPGDETERVRRGCNGCTVLGLQSAPLPPRHLTGSPDEPSIEAGGEGRDPDAAGCVDEGADSLQVCRVVSVDERVHRRPVVGVTFKTAGSPPVAIDTLLGG